MTRAPFIAAFAAATGIFAYAAGRGVTGSGIAAALAALVAAGFVTWWMARTGRPAIDLSGCPRWLGVVSGVAAIVALAQIARLTVFMVDPTQAAFSFMPSSEWEKQHSCLSAYHVAAASVSGPTSIYDDSLYSLPNDDPKAMRKARMLGAFKIDVFEYPPPFLLLPAVLQRLTPEFLDLRMLWFALSGGLLLYGLAVVAAGLGPAQGTRALLAAPFVWLALTTMSTLQKGNVQVIIVVCAMLAMLLFGRRSDVVGGALLAFATASKLYPGLLVVYLLVRRQWRAVGWTAAWGVTFCLLTLAAFGTAPYAGFLDHLPRLLSGEAFPAFRNPVAMAMNQSVPGLLYKARIFGFEGATFDRMKIVGTAWMLVATAIVAWAGRRAPRDADRPGDADRRGDAGQAGGAYQPRVWLAIIILATLRSPFLPQAYGVLPSLWLLTLIAAGSSGPGRAPGGRALAWAFAAWIVLAFNWPVDRPIDLRLLAAASLVQMTVTAILVVLALRRTPAPAAQGA